MSNKLTLLLKTSRPLFWAGPLLMLFLGFYLSGAALSTMFIIQFILFLFPFNVFLYGINDIYDYESDKDNPRKNDVMGVKLHPTHHAYLKKISYWMIGLLVISSLFTRNVENILVMIVLLFFSYTYSAPPLRLKVHPPLDSLSNGVIYFLGPVFLGYSFGQSVFTIHPKIYFVALCVVGAHALSTIVDYTYDKKAGDRTFAVVYGKKAASAVPALTFLIALLFGGFSSLVIQIYLIACICMSTIIFFTESEKLMRVFFHVFYFGALVVALLWFIL